MEVDPTTMSKPNILVRVVAAHFVAGLIIDGETGTCIRAAPILGWARGMGSDDLRREFVRRNHAASVLRPKSGIGIWQQAIQAGKEAGDQQQKTRQPRQ